MSYSNNLVDLVSSIIDTKDSGKENSRENANCNKDELLKKKIYSNENMEKQDSTTLSKKNKKRRRMSNLQVDIKEKTRKKEKIHLNNLDKNEKSSDCVLNQTEENQDLFAEKILDDKNSLLIDNKTSESKQVNREFTIKNNQDIYNNHEKSKTSYLNRSLSNLLVYLDINKRTLAGYGYFYKDNEYYYKSLDNTSNGYILMKTPIVNLDRFLSRIKNIYIKQNESLSELQLNDLDNVIQHIIHNEKFLNHNEDYEYRDVLVDEWINMIKASQIIIKCNFSGDGDRLCDVSNSNDCFSEGNVGRCGYILSRPLLKTSKIFLPSIVKFVSFCSDNGESAEYVLPQNESVSFSLVGDDFYAFITNSLQLRIYSSFGILLHQRKLSNIPIALTGSSCYFSIIYSLNRNQIDLNIRNIKKKISSDVNTIQLKEGTELVDEKEMENIFLDYHLPLRSDEKIFHYKAEVYEITQKNFPYSLKLIWHTDFTLIYEFIKIVSFISSGSIIILTDSIKGYHLGFFNSYVSSNEKIDENSKSNFQSGISEIFEIEQKENIKNMIYLIKVNQDYLIFSYEAPNANLEYQNLYKIEFSYPQATLKNEIYCKNAPKLYLVTDDKKTEKEPKSISDYNGTRLFNMIKHINSLNLSLSESKIEKSKLEFTWVKEILFYIKNDVSTEKLMILFKSLSIKSLEVLSKHLPRKSKYFNVFKNEIQIKSNTVSSNIEHNLHNHEKKQAQSICENLKENQKIQNLKTLINRSLGIKKKFDYTE